MNILALERKHQNSISTNLENFQMKLKSIFYTFNISKTKFYYQDLICETLKFFKALKAKATPLWNGY